MNLDEDEIQSLFDDDRGDDSFGAFHIGIDRRVNGVCIYTDDEQFILTDNEKEDLLDHLGVDSIWAVLSESTKALEYLR